MDEKVGVVAGGVAAQVDFQRGLAGIGGNINGTNFRKMGGGKRKFAARFGGDMGQGRQSLRVIAQGRNDGGRGGGVDFILPGAAAIVPAFPVGQWPVFDGNGQDALGVIPLPLAGLGQEKAALALGIVALHIDGIQTEMHFHAVGGFPVVVKEMLGGFDIVLVAVGPVQKDFLPVVGDGVGIAAAGVAALGDKVAVPVVAAEKGVEVVVDFGFYGGAAAAAGGVGLGGQVVLAGAGIMKLGVQLSRCVDGIFRQSFMHPAGGGLQPLLGLGLPHQRPAIQGRVNVRRQLIGNKVVHHRPLVVHNAVDAKVQFGAVELEQFPQQGLEFIPGRRDNAGGHKAAALVKSALSRMGQSRTAFKCCD